MCLDYVHLVPQTLSFLFVQKIISACRLPFLIDLVILVVIRVSSPPHLPPKPAPIPSLMQSLLLLMLASIHIISISLHPFTDPPVMTFVIFIYALVLQDATAAPFVPGLQVIIQAVDCSCHELSIYGYLPPALLQFPYKLALSCDRAGAQVSLFLLPLPVVHVPLPAGAFFPRLILFRGINGSLSCCKISVKRLLLPPSACSDFLQCCHAH